MSDSSSNRFLQENLEENVQGLFSCSSSESDSDSNNDFFSESSVISSDMSGDNVDDNFDKFLFKYEDIIMSSIPQTSLFGFRTYKNLIDTENYDVLDSYLGKEMFCCGICHYLKTQTKEDLIEKYLPFEIDEIKRRRVFDCFALNTSTFFSSGIFLKNDEYFIGSNRNYLNVLNVATFEKVYSFKFSAFNCTSTCLKFLERFNFLCINGGTEDLIFIDISCLILGMDPAKWEFECVDGISFRKRHRRKVVFEIVENERCVIGGVEELLLKYDIDNKEKREIEIENFGDITKILGNNNFFYAFTRNSIQKFDIDLNLLKLFEFDEDTNSEDEYFELGDSILTNNRILVFSNDGYVHIFDENVDYLSRIPVCVDCNWAIFYLIDNIPILLFNDSRVYLINIETQKSHLIGWFGLNIDKFIFSKDFHTTAMLDQMGLVLFSDLYSYLVSFPYFFIENERYITNDIHKLFSEDLKSYLIRKNSAQVNSLNKLNNFVDDKNLTFFNEIHEYFDNMIESQDFKELINTKNSLSDPITVFEFSSVYHIFDASCCGPYHFLLVEKPNFENDSDEDCFGDKRLVVFDEVEKKIVFESNCLIDFDDDESDVNLIEVSNDLKYFCINYLNQLHIFEVGKWNDPFCKIDFASFNCIGFSMFSKIKSGIIYVGDQRYFQVFRFDNNVYICILQIDVCSDVEDCCFVDYFCFNQEENMLFITTDNGVVAYYSLSEDFAGFELKNTYRWLQPDISSFQNLSLNKNSSVICIVHQSKIVFWDINEASKPKFVISFSDITDVIWLNNTCAMMIPLDGFGFYFVDIERGIVEKTIRVGNDESFWYKPIPLRKNSKIIDMDDKISDVLYSFGGSSKLEESKCFMKKYYIHDIFSQIENFIAVSNNSDFFFKNIHQFKNFFVHPAFSEGFIRKVIASGYVINEFEYNQIINFVWDLVDINMNNGGNLFEFNGDFDNNDDEDD
eukprot:TRINITY_DN2960_c0_g1_i1.p1 TRINITY_DN2960_c0_g1~~TRINITY_DN2960_c0_g1_i1.p1  ORF type:complete len:978 (+),score=305.04 TRINITY_DN2960_c0_g1_i1:49-2934(+)